MLLIGENDKVVGKLMSGHWNAKLRLADLVKLYLGGDCSKRSSADFLLSAEKRSQAPSGVYFHQSET